jgi:ABC-type amino acid transport system permease subunit
VAERARSIGWRDAFIVGAVAVAAVLGAQVLSELFPAVGDVFRRTPVIVIGLVVATGLVLWRIAAGRPVEPPEPPQSPES